MEQGPEFSDALFPHPIERSESPPPAAVLQRFDEVEGGGAEDGVDGMDDSQLVGSPTAHLSASAGDEEEIEVAEFASPAAAAGEEMLGEESVQTAVEEGEPIADTASVGVVKRKRGRPPKSQSGRAQGVRAPVKRKEKEEEEVCFICFDGGSLVVCDRRGCPKVYHPACINRDDAFFHSRGRWNCGWHICSICQKSAHYMCYTCTYSLCKGCNKEAEFICVRGNKGLCGTCYRTIMLIESNEVGVDFDDQNSWEHLFKIYWLDLKGKLLLTQEELSSAKNRRKGSRSVTRNDESSDESYNGNDDQESSSDSSSERRIGSNSSRKKVRRRSRNVVADESSVKQVDYEGPSTTEDTEWASKELLEFVAHMKDGSTSILSQFDVQALLLEYIKRNNLRDPRRKSQIICDSRLQNLFGKARVGHFEMLKLLESHFLIKEASQIVTDDNQGGVVDPDSSQMDAEGYSDAATKISSDKRRKSRKRVEEREPQTNLDDYAAIDVHNINLIYLRRNLMEDLIDDIDKFNEKVIGAFVRIRISGAGQRQDMYRLVQVVGTNKVAEKYKTGKKTTNFTLDILNLNKSEVITIDTISNQEFTEEECKRLRQSIKCGLINRLRVGEIQEKARVLQAVRVNDWLESEKLRLGHLRDRASEKGRRKELRECVEKLQFLNTPEERRRRLNEIPEIHTDPNMDPAYESADEEDSDDKNQDNYSRSRESFSLRKREALSSGKGGSNWNDVRKSSNTTWEINRSAPVEAARDKVDLFSSVGDRTDELSWTQGKDVHNSSWGPPNALANTSVMEPSGWNNNQSAVKPEQSYGVAPEATSVLLPTGISAPSNTSETEKMWNYLDPSGKVQGPFSMAQMRKWSTTGYFPPDLRIWRTAEKQDDPILLTDALNGKFQKALPQREPPHNSFPQPTNIAAAMDSNSLSWVDNSNQNRVQWNAGRNDAGFSAAANTELVNVDRLVNQPPAWFAPKIEVANPMEARIGSRGWEPPRDPNAWSGQPQAHSSLRPTAPFPGNYYQPPPYQGSGGRGGNAGRWNRGQDRGSAWNSNRPRGPRPSGQGYEGQQPNWSSSGQQSPGEVWKPRPVNESRNQWGNDSFNPPSPTPQPSSGGWANVQGAVNPSSTVFQHMGSGLGTTPNTGITMVHQSPAATMESNRAASAANPVGGWGSSSESNVLKQTGKADGWGSWSAASASMPGKAKAVGGWDSWSAATASMPDKTQKEKAVDASQIPKRLDGLGESRAIGKQNEPSESDAPDISGNQPTLPWDGKNPSDSSTAMGGSTTNELNEGVKEDRFLQGDCPSPTPLSERQELSVIQHSELDPGKIWTEVHGKSTAESGSVSRESRGSDPTSAALSLGTSNMPTSATLSFEAQNNQSLLSGMEDKRISPAASTIPTAESESQGWSPTSAMKQDGPSLSIPPSENKELNQSQKQDSCSREEQLDTQNGEWSLPSPTPSTKPTAWDLGADSTSGNRQNNQWASSDGSKSPSYSQPKVGTCTETTQPSNPGWGMAPQNPSRGIEAAQGNGNTGWGTAIQGNTNKGWVATAQGNTNAAWGTAAQPNPNPNTGWGPPAQGSMNPSPGWGAPVQGGSNPNTSWVAPIPNAGWRAPTQGNTMNPSWGGPAQGNVNPNPGWGTPAPGNTGQSLNLGVQGQQGNTNSNPGWGTGQGNPSSWGTRPNQNQVQNGDRYDAGGQGYQSSRMQSGGGGRSSRPPPRGQGPRVGVCKFHENGYCKKGSACNYLHS